MCHFTFWYEFKIQHKNLKITKIYINTFGFFLQALAETGEWIQLETILIISGFFRGATLINMMLVISEYCDSKMDKLPAAFGIHMVAKGIFIVALGPVIGK